ncbi:scavenger receptor cysteine-rich type 1 protein M130-like [Patiria miniata]|uniref:SRCR domain-containing protein n=1 Tax=Patiria miniata TaxID=46514 RepID=A0A913Z839_PATMI|nr:scavenger receptor cysteine-rich type 1 protein M130-like [Patiria miniata]
MLFRFASSLLWTAAFVNFGALGVSAKTCYYGQEPDPSRGGKLRWTVSLGAGAGGDLCSCTSLRPGALSVITPSRRGQPLYTDRPVFTDDQQEIMDLFDCHADGSIRLVDGNGHLNPIEGRVEVYYGSEWGTVCDDFWNKYDGIVVCRQLGYSYPYVQEVLPLAHFGKGKGPIHLDNVRCLGSEASLAGCRHVGWGVHDCFHYEDAGVRCATNVSSAA